MQVCGNLKQTVKWVILFGGANIYSSVDCLTMSWVEVRHTRIIGANPFLWSMPSIITQCKQGLDEMGNDRDQMSGHKLELKPEKAMILHSFKSKKLLVLAQTVLSLCKRAEVLTSCGLWGQFFHRRTQKWLRLCKGASCTDFMSVASLYLVKWAQHVDPLEVWSWLHLIWPSSEELAPLRALTDYCILPAFN